MEILLSNAIGKARRESLLGRAYLVVPATSIVPGVLPGSQGDLYYPPSETGRDPRAWDGMPLVHRHPMDPATNLHVSARSPKVIESQGLGWIYGSTFNGKLQHECWFDEEWTRNADKRFKTDILAKLIKGEPIELSTGLYTDNEEKPAVCPVTGRSYSAVARNHRPDHLAVLPDQKGACSVQDGCGIGVNESKCCEGKSEDEMCDKCKKEMKANAGKYRNPQSTATGKFKPFGSGTGKGDVHDAAQQGGMTLTFDDKERGAAALAEFKATGSNPASWVEDEDVWERAKAAADKGGYGEDSYYAVVTHIYKNMGGGIKEATSNHGEHAKSLEQTSNFDPDQPRESDGKWSGGAGGSASDTAGKVVEAIGSAVTAPARMAVEGIAKAGKAYADNMGILIADSKIGKAVAYGAKENIKDAPRIFQGIFSRVTLGTGPLAVGAIKLGLKVAPKAFGLLAGAMKGIASAAGWGKEKADYEAMRSSTLAQPIGANAKHEDHADEAEMIEAFGKLDELAELLEENEEEAERFREALIAIESGEYGLAENSIADLLEFDLGLKLNQGDDVMTRAECIKIVANCDCWRGQEEVLNKMSDEQLVKLKANADLTREAAMVVNALRKDFDLDPKLALNEMPAALKAALDKKAGKEEEEEEEEEEVANARKPLTQRLTPEELGVWNYAAKRFADDKRQIVVQLLANVSDGKERDRIGNALMKKELAELQDMVALLPQPNANQRQQEYSFAPSYAGAAGGPVGLTDNEQADVLDLESLRANYEKKAV